MAKTYLVTLHHSHCPELAGEHTFVVHRNGHDGSFYATARGFGCGKDARTALDAIARLYRDHACTLLSVRLQAGE
jgi:hypothetical protein